jgi:hypothetical protein
LKAGGWVMGSGGEKKLPDCPLFLFLGASFGKVGRWLPLRQASKVRKCLT